jgi:hypothetical protein
MIALTVTTVPPVHASITPIIRKPCPSKQSCGHDELRDPDDELLAIISADPFSAQICSVVAGYASISGTYLPAGVN